MKKALLLAAAVMVAFAGQAESTTYIFNTSDNPFDPGVKNQGWWSTEVFHSKAPNVVGDGGCSMCSGVSGAGSIDLMAS